MGLGLLLGLAGAVSAHPLAPSLLALDELDEATPGLVRVTWKTPLQTPAGVRLRPLLPAHCTQRTEGVASEEGTGLVLRFRVDCGERGLVGSTLSIADLDRSGTNALLRVALADGRAFQTVLRASQPSFTVPDRPAAAHVVKSYALLGLSHITFGIDHLLFVLALVLLVRGGRVLVLTITAFTVGHSITLSLAALGAIRLPTAPLEVAIAASLLVVALELAHEGRGGETQRLGRFPQALAFAFGLLHGLAFASALAQIGLPQAEIPLALLAFNVGIELGQLAFVAATLCLLAALRPIAARAPATLGSVPAYAIGTLSVYFLLDRVAALGG